MSGALSTFGGAGDNQTFWKVAVSVVTEVKQQEYKIPRYAIVLDAVLLAVFFGVAITLAIQDRALIAEIERTPVEADSEPADLHDLVGKLLTTQPLTHMISPI